MGLLGLGVSTQGLPPCNGCSQTPQCLPSPWQCGLGSALAWLRDPNEITLPCKSVCLFPCGLRAGPSSICGSGPVRELVLVLLGMLSPELLLWTRHKLTIFCSCGCSA